MKFSEQIDVAESLSTLNELLLWNHSQVTLSTVTDFLFFSFYFFHSQRKRSIFVKDVFWIQTEWRLSESLLFNQLLKNVETAPACEVWHHMFDF